MATSTRLYRNRHGTEAEGGIRRVHSRLRHRCVVLVDALGHLAAPAMDIGQRANRRQVLGRAAQHVFELG